MTAKFVNPAVWIITVLIGLSTVGAALSQERSKAQPTADSGTMKLEVQLLWGTNDDQSPDKNHQPVDPDVRKRLKELPLKWSNYFLVTRKNFEVHAGEIKKEPLSEKCAIEVKNLGNGSIEVTQYGKTGQQLWKGTQALPKGQVLFLGGNAPNATSWLVLLKRIE